MGSWFRPHVVALLGGIAAPLLLSAGMASAQDAAAPRFPTPEAAAEALVGAIAARDSAKVEAILGPEFSELLRNEGEEALDTDRQRFLDAAARAKVIRPSGEDRAIVEVGLQGWPLPAPLVRDAQGWYFDGAEGVEVVRDRLVGRNELKAIEVLRAYVDAQVAYAQQDRDGDGVLEYARRIGSTPGTHDGLYWPARAGEETSPFGPFIAAAGVNTENRRSDAPFYGYYYRIMTRQGENPPGGAYDYVINDNMIAGFAMVAWPAQYGDSGVMTFVVNQRGVVQEKDMGATTEDIGPKMRTYNPDAGWGVVED
ncbi:MAG TPA: DUF2950 domain-containing protein [Geminicoccaceae bacterium]|nr:DUF2950 domain-containing protein [Geminicoccus sp.]HMU53031.1 DUF2950 domain-containing protein [Geminicoccaceae bacterium]